MRAWKTALLAATLAGATLAWAARATSPAVSFVRFESSAFRPGCRASHGDPQRWAVLQDRGPCPAEITGMAAADAASGMARTYTFDAVSDPVFSRWLGRATAAEPDRPANLYYIRIPRAAIDDIPENEWTWATQPRLSGSRVMHFAADPGQEGHFFVAAYPRGKSGRASLTTSLKLLSDDEIATWRSAGVKSIGVEMTLDIGVQALRKDATEPGVVLAEVFWDVESGGRRLEQFFFARLAHGPDGWNRSILSGEAVVPLSDFKQALEFFQVVSDDRINFKRLRIEITAQR